MLLAAGAGRRLGRPKALVEVGGARLVDHGVRVLADGGADPVVVVTGAAPVTVPGVIMAVNPDWASGMGSSLAAGLRAVRPAARRRWWPWWTSRWWGRKRSGG